MLLTIFGLVLIIISETLLFSSVEAHTFQITAYCPETDPGQIPRPINEKAFELLITCLDKNALVIRGVNKITPYKISGLKIKKMENDANICTYTLENKTTVVPTTIETKRGEFVCDDYSEFQIKIIAYCDASQSSLFKTPKPINANAVELYNVCMGSNGKFGHEIRVNEVMGEKGRIKKYICTYIFEMESWEGNCVNYSEKIDEEDKKLMEQNAKVGGKSSKEMKKKSTA